jgi:hypothetical protein
MAALFFVLSIVVRRGPEIHNPRDDNSTEVRAGSARDFPADINDTTVAWWAMFAREGPLPRIQACTPGSERLL